MARALLLNIFRELAALVLGQPLANTPEQVYPLQNAEGLDTDEYGPRRSWPRVYLATTTETTALTVGEFVQVHARDAAGNLTCRRVHPNTRPAIMPATHWVLAAAQGNYLLAQLGSGDYVGTGYTASTVYVVGTDQRPAKVGDSNYPGTGDPAQPVGYAVDTALLLPLGDSAAVAATPAPIFQSGQVILAAGVSLGIAATLTTASRIFVNRRVGAGTLGDLSAIAAIASGTTFDIKSYTPGTASTVQTADVSQVDWLVYTPAA